MSLIFSDCPGDDKDVVSIDDKDLLARRGMPADGPGLVAFFSKRSVNAAD